MRILAYLAGVFVAQVAVADPGHLAEVAGHGHVVAGIAIGTAIAVGLWGILKGKGPNSNRPDPENASDTNEAQEA